MPDLNVAREGPAVASVENQLWIIGGKVGSGDDDFQGSVEIFDKSSSKWILYGKDSGLTLDINKNQECQSIIIERMVS
jgi:hypothetical protein